ncbi:MAG: DUF1684 domain-containing protein [Saprospiraceae bacterium]|nr:DUF1684 domain-containing protein [Saprospiraceae bacterium]
MKYTLTTCFLLIGWLFLLPAQNSDPYYFADINRHRNEYKADFLTNPRSPLAVADTAFLDFFPPDGAYQFFAQFERTPEAVPFELPTYSGQKRNYVQYGVLKFDFNGQAQSLNIYQNLHLVKDSIYHDHLFLPFKDLTSGETTYGGGRYLDFKQGDIYEDIMVLDFNKCYNPWCAFSDGYNCPIPPAANHLEIAIEAGERNFKGPKKH